MLALGPIAAQGPGTLAELAFDYAAGAGTLLAWCPTRPCSAGTARPAVSASPTTARSTVPCPARTATPAAAPAWPPKPTSGTGGSPATGPQHYAAAEQLLEHAATMLDADVDPQRAAELVQRQIAVATLGQAHALLAAAAGLSARMGPLDEQEWRGAAAARPE